MKASLWEVMERKPRKNAGLGGMFAMGRDRKATMSRPAMPLPYIAYMLLVKINNFLIIYNSE